MIRGKRKRGIKKEKAARMMQLYSNSLLVLRLCPRPQGEDNVIVLGWMVEGCLTLSVAAKVICI
jgi:hypothetical protein